MLIEFNGYIDKVSKTKTESTIIQGVYEYYNFDPRDLETLKHFQMNAFLFIFYFANDFFTYLKGAYWFHEHFRFPLF